MLSAGMLIKGFSPFIQLLNVVKESRGKGIALLGNKNDICDPFTVLVVVLLGYVVLVVQIELVVLIAPHHGREDI